MIPPPNPAPPARKRLGLIVNPVAGLGGRVGLKGSDGLEIQRQALALGAVPQAASRAQKALEVLLPDRDRLEVLTCPGEMGAQVAQALGFDCQVTGTIMPGQTTAEDTLQAAQAMLDSAVDLLLFAGGDGTARDIYRAVGDALPALGIPAGVKIHSAAFGASPQDAGALARAFLFGASTCREAEVIDLDEQAYRRGEVATILYGYLKVPYQRRLIQNQKVPTPASEAVQAEAIAVDLIENMQDGWLYVLGPGTTVRAIASRLGLPKTLVGVDVVTPHATVAPDASERQILDLIAGRPAKIVLTPIGGQGFLIGRGNQQISPQVIRTVGKDNLIVVSLPQKIAALRGRPLLVDSGDEALDQTLSGYISVITGYHTRIIYQVG